MGGWSSDNPISWQLAEGDMLTRSAAGDRECEGVVMICFNSESKGSRDRAVSGKWKQGAGLFLAALMPAAALAQSTNESLILANLSFEQLSQIQIVSAAKHPQNASDAPAAVHVVTAQDIAESGATSIPEALRAVPGLDVAQINSQDWAIGARGFQSQFATKMLVLMDGRSVYSPVYGGVNWGAQDYFLDDLERIEVVLGPGGAIWGANAMNGVVNVISKSARDTQGDLLYGGGGNDKLVLAGERHGWKIDDDTFARVYLKYFQTDGTLLPNGAYPNNNGRSGQGGFRLDGQPDPTTQLTVQGDLFLSQNDYIVNLPNAASPTNYLRNTSGIDQMGGNLLGRWEKTFNENSRLSLQGYYDYYARNWALNIENAHTADLELQHTWTGWRRQQINWGCDYRHVTTFSDPAWVRLPGQYDSDLFSGFFQDEISLVENRLTLTAGAKLEHTAQSGFQPQPNVRLAWHPTENQTVWAAWSQAIRTPAEVEVNSQVDAKVIGPATFLQVTGNPGVDPETLNAWELGWRWEASKTLSFDASTFYYMYDSLISYGLGTPQTVAGVTYYPALAQNGLNGHSYGGEMGVQWKPLDRWRLRASYSRLRILLEAYKPDPLDFVGDEHTSPEQTINLDSAIKLAENLDFDTGLRFVDQIPYYSIGSYWEMDARLAWQPRKNLEVAVVGQNLLHAQHVEYHPALVGPTTAIERGVYAKITLKF
jgi:iron complex outermembrane recepter protein